MRTVSFVWLSLFCLPFLQAPGRAQTTNEFELRDGDRVVLVGDTLMEREQSYGFIEFLLTTHFPDRNVTFRNLGWSADIPEGQSRVGFDHEKPPSFWFEQLTNSIAQTKPTVVFLGYGMANSFDGEAAVPKFIAEMERLMDALQQNATAEKLRFVLLSPVPHEKLPGALPDPAKHNAQLAAYTQALKDLAARRNAHFINLFSVLGEKNVLTPASPMTDDGIHLTDYGYRRAAEEIGRAFHWDAHACRLGVLADGKIRNGSYGAKVLELKKDNDHFRAVLELEQVVNPPWPSSETPKPLRTPPNRLQVVGLKQGEYDLKIDGEFIRTVSDAQSRTSFLLDRGPEFDQAEELRQTILKKNELFFHRWRPQNNTYLFLFRKYEQGQNAREIPQFDPLIAEQEKKIAALRKPRRLVIELAPHETTAALPCGTTQAQTAPAPLTTLPHPQFDLDTDLEVSLYAENPLLAKPIHMNFDAQGRLWVASSEVYPQIKPGQEANDKIIVLEDKDGDGKAETSSVFADHLLIPTGVAPGDGGVYVGQSTELLYFRDMNEDGRADERRVALSAFGTEDTHHILHTLRWGEDGQLYMNQSIYIHTHTETPHGVIRLNSGGILNLRPGTMELGIHMKGLVNSWGHAIDRFGQSFATDGASSADAGQGGIFYVVPQGMYLTYAGARRILPSVSPGSYPKFSGLEIIRTPHFPESWQGNFVTCDFRAHRVVRFSITDKDSAYVTETQPDLIRTKDVTFRPIDVKLGPDGALYIADWSNPIIQHGEVDFRDPRRDHEHGRIWRVTYKNRPLVERPSLAKLSNEQLLDNLLAPDHFTRTQSKRLLLERVPSALSDSGAWTTNRSNLIADLTAWQKKQTNEQTRLEALWMHQAIDNVEPALLEELLNARDGRIRAAGVRVLAFWQDRQPTSTPGYAKDWQGWEPAPLPLPYRREIPTSRALELLAARIADEHPRVRLEALRALARIPNARAAELALSVLDKPLDPFLDYTLWLTMNDLADPWLAAIKSGAWKAEGHEKQLEFGLKAIEPAQASAVLGLLIGDKPLPRDGSGPWIELIGQAGTPREFRQLFEQTLQGGFDPAATARALAALNRGARLQSVKPAIEGLSQSAYFSKLGTFLEATNEKVRLEAIQLAGAWKDIGDAFGLLPKLASDQGASLALRQAALNGIRDVGGTRATDALVPLTARAEDPMTRRQAVLALASLKLEKALSAALEILNEMKNEEEALNLWRALLSNKGAASALAKALPKSGIPPLVAKAGLRAAREGGRNEPELVLAITRGSGLDEGEVTLTDAELKQLAADVAAKGDAVRGEAIYRRKELNCVGCHAIGGAGGKVGPDMTSIGASAPIDYLIESVWFPNKKIKEGYHALSVETKDGLEYSGVLVRENTEQLVLRDASGKEITIAKNNIEDRRVGTLSLMPAGLIDNLSAQERIDVFRFLSELGKPGPFDATKGNVARVWRVRPGIHTIEQFGEEKFVTSDLNGKEWSPVYANVDGRLSAETIREAATPGKYLGLVGLYAATQLQLPKESSVKFTLTGGADAIWIDGKAQKPGTVVNADLPAGNHTIVLRLDPKKLPDTLRVEASEGMFLVN
jgi:putative heme-binding domain-containing protein